MSNFLNSKIFKSILSKIPLLALMLITISTNYYYFFNDSYSIYYELISYCTGFSLMSLPAYFYIVYKFKFCQYSKLAVWGLLIYVSFNIVWFVLEKLMGLDRGMYMNIVESTSITIPFIISCYYLVKRK